jgi:hypothetical protein
VVFPSSDQTSNFTAIFEPKLKPVEPPSGAAAAVSSPTPQLPTAPGERPAETPVNPGAEKEQSPFLEPVILTEEDALYQLRAIPLYFPTSYSLVKPYVAGFELNSLDAVTLTNVVIDNDWRPADSN